MNPDRSIAEIIADVNKIGAMISYVLAFDFLFQLDPQTKIEAQIAKMYCDNFAKAVYELTPTELISYAKTLEEYSRQFAALLDYEAHRPRD